MTPEIKPVVPDDVAPDMTDDPNGEAVTPEEQGIYNRFVAQAQLLIYNEKMTAKYFDMLNSSETKNKDIGQFAANVAFRVYSAAKEAGEDIPGDVVLHGGAEIVESLIELAEEAKIVEIDEGQMEEIFYAASDFFRGLMEGSGSLDQAAIKEDMALFAQAEQSGQLEQMIGGVASEQAAPAAPAAPQAAPAVPMPPKPMGAM